MADSGQSRIPLRASGGSQAPRGPVAHPIWEEGTAQPSGELHNYCVNVKLEEEPGLGEHDVKAPGASRLGEPCTGSLGGVGKPAILEADHSPPPPWALAARQSSSPCVLCTPHPRSFAHHTLSPSPSHLSPIRSQPPATSPDHPMPSHVPHLVFPTLPP